MTGRAGLTLRALAAVASLCLAGAFAAAEPADAGNRAFCTTELKGDLVPASQYSHPRLVAFPGRDFALARVKREGVGNFEFFGIGADFGVTPLGLPGMLGYSVEPGGRVLLVDKQALYVLAPGDRIFRRLLRLDGEHFFSFKIMKLEDTGEVVVNRFIPRGPTDWAVVRDNALLPWPDWTEMRALGAESLEQLIHEPITGMLIALVQESEREPFSVYARAGDGRWHEIYTLRKSWRSLYLGEPRLRMQFVPGTGRIAITTDGEAFTIDPAADPPKAESVLVARELLGLGHLMVSEATANLLLLDTKNSMEKPSSSDLYHLTADGLVPVPGDPVRIEDPKIWNYLTDLPSIRRVAVAAEGRLWLYDGETAQEVEDYASVGRGERIHWWDHAAIGRVLGRSVSGLFTLSRAGKIEPVGVPFSLKTGPSPDGPLHKEELVDWPSQRVVVAMTREGTFVIDGDLDVVQIDSRRLKPHLFASQYSADVAAGSALFSPLKDGIFGIRAVEGTGEGAVCD